MTEHVDVVAVFVVVVVIFVVFVMACRFLETCPREMQQRGLRGRGARRGAMHKIYDRIRPVQVM
jgi:hypothetical protein